MPICFNSPYYKKIKFVDNAIDDRILTFKGKTLTPAQTEVKTLHLSIHYVFENCSEFDHY